MNATVPSVCSYGWRSILHGRDLLKPNLGKAIGNGITTKVWQDNWISLQNQAKPYGPISEAYLDLKVADLLTTDIKWNMNRIEEILPQMTAQIQCLQPSREGAEDAFIWQPLCSGKYSTHSCYYSATMENDRSLLAPQEDFNWTKDILSGSFSPKMKSFL